MLDFIYSFNDHSNVDFSIDIQTFLQLQGTIVTQGYFLTTLRIIIQDLVLKCWKMHDFLSDTQLFFYQLLSGRLIAKISRMILV